MTSSGADPSRSSISSVTAAADRVTASRSFDGDSTLTRRARSPSIASRVDTESGVADDSAAVIDARLVRRVPGSPPAGVLNCRMSHVHRSAIDRPPRRPRRVPARPARSPVADSGWVACRPRPPHPGLAPRGGGDARRRVRHLVHVARTRSTDQRFRPMSYGRSDGHCDSTTPGSTTSPPSANQRWRCRPRSAPTVPTTCRRRCAG